MFVKQNILKTILTAS